MKEGRSLQEVLQELKLQNEIKSDFITPAQAMTLLPDGNTLHVSSG